MFGHEQCQWGHAFLISSSSHPPRHEKRCLVDWDKGIILDMGSGCRPDQPFLGLCISTQARRLFRYPIHSRIMDYRLQYMALCTRHLNCFHGLQLWRPGGPCSSINSSVRSTRLPTTLAFPLHQLLPRPHTHTACTQPLYTHSQHFFDLQTP